MKLEPSNPSIFARMWRSLQGGERPRENHPNPERTVPRLAHDVMEAPAITRLADGPQAPRPSRVRTLRPIVPLELSRSRLVSSIESDRRLGLKRVEGGMPLSKAHDILGADRMVPVQAVPVAGRVAWVNFDLARKLGFTVPEGNRMTPEFHAELMRKLAFKTVPEGVEAKDTLTVEADRYGGDGIAVKDHSNLTGAGRAAFLAHGNLNVKGIGRTPLANSPNFHHSHGGAPMREGFLEAIWGEVNNNLFSAGSTSILAVIDTHDDTQWDDGSKEPRALIVRAGRQIRPANLIDGGGRSQNFSHDVFVRATRDSGDLVERKGKIDLDATMRNVIAKHARTAAEQVRYRVLHGALSTSNMELDGSQLDLGTQTSQPRTAPIKVLDFKVPFGQEHADRAMQLAKVYETIRSTMTPRQRKNEHVTRFSVTRELKVAYEKELRQQLVQATGLKADLAAALQGSPEATAFADLIKEMAKLKNRTAPHDPALNADKTIAEDVAVLDVFHLLQHYPAIYFADPKADHTEKIRELLRPILRGSRQAQARRNWQIDRFCDNFAARFDDLMKVASEKSPDFYDAHSFARSVTQRAAFENAPLDKLYRSQIRGRLDDAISKYRQSGDTTVFKEAADQVIAASLRSTEGLLAQGGHRAIHDGGIALEERTIAGIDYSVRAWSGGGRELHLDMPAEGNDDTGYVMSTLPGATHLHRDQIEALRYRFSTDGWKTWQEAPAHLEWRDGKPFITITIPALSGESGQLDGIFHCTARGDFWLRDQGSNFSGYTFAIPDDHDLKALK